MFAISGLYNYATSSSSSNPSTSNSTSTSTPAATRVKRHANKSSRGSNHPTHPPTHPLPSPRNSLDDLPPPSYASVAADPSPDPSSADQNELAKRAVVDEIIKQQDLYKVLGIHKKAKVDEIRRAFLNRSRVCHPDKFPNYPPSTLAFQRVSFAYETLSKPNSRRIYDVSGRHDLASAMNGGSGGSPSSQSYSNNDGMGMGMGDETLNGVLYSVFCEFMEGDFEMIRVLVSAMNEGNPGLNLGEEAVENLEGAFNKMREFMLNGKRYLSIIRFELIRLYEIQHSLRSLSYFDVFGRLRLTLQLAKVTIGIPLAIDQAMKDGDGQEEEENVDEKDDSQEEQEQDEEEQEWQSKPNWSRKTNFRTAAPSSPHQDEFGMISESENERDQDEGESMGERIRRERRERKRKQKENEELLKRRNLKNSRRKRADDRTGSRDDADQDQDQEKVGKNKSTNRKSFVQLEEEEEEAEINSESGSRFDGEEADEEEATDQGSERKTSRSKNESQGLFGPTTSRLLGGVVKVLETSESWVPGKRTEPN